MALLLFALILLTGTNGGYAPSEPFLKKVKFSKIQTLIFYKNVWTINRYSAPRPQLRCIGGSAGCDWIPSSVQCRNLGVYDFVPQWNCSAGIPRNINFGTLNVSCEGFDGPDDPYILVGSCGLEYTLETFHPPATFLENVALLLLVMTVLHVFSAIGFATHAEIRGRGFGFWEGFILALLLFPPWGGA